MLFCEKGDSMVVIKNSENRRAKKDDWIPKPMGKGNEKEGSNPRYVERSNR